MALYCSESIDEVVYSADLAGVPKDSLDIRYEAGRLTVVGKHGDLEYHASANVRAKVDASKATAMVAGGILTVRLPRLDVGRSTRIEVK